MNRRFDLPSAALLATWALLLLVEPARSAGVAPLVVAAFLSVLLRSGAAPTTPWATALRDTLPALVAGALLGRAMIGWGLLPALVLPGVVVVASGVATGRRASMWAALALLVGGVALATSRGAPVEAGIDLLRPTWGGMTTWWGPTLVLAALGAAWPASSPPARPPGSTARPLTGSPGLLLIFALLLVWAMSLGWSAAPTATPALAPTALALLSLAAVPAGLAARGPVTTALVGGAGVGTALLDPAGAALLLGVCLPGALGVERLLTARSERSGWAGLTALLLLAGAAGSWSGLPATVPAAAWLGVVVGAMIWIVGLAALRAEGAAWR